MTNTLISPELESKIRATALENLERAEQTWSKHGQNVTEGLVKASRLDSADSPTHLPGHALIREPEVGEFVALVADIRNSTTHLLEDTHSSRPYGLERIYYETSAFLPGVEVALAHYDGQIKEFLGDGALGFFNARGDKKTSAILKAYSAARTCLDYVRPIVNGLLEERHKLPALEIGIGLAYSKAIVERIGSDRHARVVGKCVYQASKLSNGMNEICVSEELADLWPRHEDGKIEFEAIEVRRTEERVAARTVRGFVLKERSAHAYFNR